MHPDSVRYGHVLHILGSDEDVLFAVRRLGSVNLEGGAFGVRNGVNGERCSVKGLTIIFMLIRRLTASINTSNSSGSR